jgi:hypothetical protein
MRTTCLTFILLCALLLQSFGIEGDKLVEPIQDSTDATPESAGGMADAQVRDDSSEEKKGDIELGLELPLTKNDQTITESGETANRTTDNIIDGYNFSKISKNISEELDPMDNQQRAGNWTQGERLLRDCLVGFIIEATFTSLVLSIVCLLLGATDAYFRIVSCGFIIAFIGATLGFALRIELLNPLRVILSFVILVPLVQWFVDIGKWSMVILISVITRVVTLAMILAAYSGASVLFGL